MLFQRSMDDEWHCYYCSFFSQSFEQTVNHAVSDHPTELLKLKVKTHGDCGTYFFKSRNFQIVPATIFANNKIITCLEESGETKIKISQRLDDSFTFTSPDKKVPRFSSTPLKLPPAPDIDSSNAVTTLCFPESVNAHRPVFNVGWSKELVSTPLSLARWHGSSISSAKYFG